MKKIEDIHILVIGDIMVDKYINGTVDRISPEAPVPVLLVTEEYSTLGGSGHVVNNIRELGPKVTCLSSVGDDLNGNLIMDKLISLGATPLLVNESKITTTKERIIANERKVQMIRIDKEEITDINSDILLKPLKDNSLLNDFDMIIISDYGKGVITKDVIDYLDDNKCIYIIDPKPKDNSYYGHPFIITPNEKECIKLGGVNKLLDNGATYVLETKGKKGMILYDQIQHWNISSEEVPVYDVQGAGDTVVAIIATCLSMGWNALDSSIFANKCAAYVVTQPGTSVVPKKLFIDLLKKYKEGIY